METLPETIGPLLRRLREGKGWTQQELGRYINMNHVQISHYETGHAIPSLEKILQFSAVFDSDPSMFGPLSRYRHWQKTEAEEQRETTPFAQLILLARKRLHLRQSEVAVAADISVEMIGYYEAGKYQPATLEKAFQLGKVLLIDPTDMRAVYTQCCSKERVGIIDGKKWCKAGKHMVPIQFFHKSTITKSKLHSYCKFCREKKRKENELP